MTESRRSWYVASAALLGLIVFGIALLVQTANFRAAVEHMAENDIRDKTQAALSVLAPLLEKKDAAAIEAYCRARRAAGVRVTIVNASGDILVDTDNAKLNHANRTEIHKALTGEDGTILRHSDTLGSYWLYCARRSGEYIVRLAISYDEVSRPVRLARNGLLAAAIVGACAVFLIFYLTRRLANRLELQAVQLAAARANEAFRRDFTSNVTHELRTPLTAILGAVEMMDESAALSEEERADLRRIIRSQASRLSALAKDVLSLARIESEQTERDPRDFSDVAIKDVLTNVMTLEVPRAKEKGVSLNWTKQANVTLRGDTDLLEQALVNLIENALRYSGSDCVELASEIKRDKLELSVTDFGIGIPAAHLPHIFERFYRVDKARSRSLGGTGLGLAIVKHIALLHGGSVEVESEQGARTTFRLILPFMTK